MQTQSIESTRMANDDPPVAERMKRAEFVTLHRSARSLPQRAFGRIGLVLRRRYWKSRVAMLGHGSDIGWSTYVFGGQSIEIGDHVWIKERIRLEAQNASRNDVRIRIGEGTVMSDYARISAVKSVIIGKGVGISYFSLITDHDHDFYDPDVPWRTNPRLLAAPVVIEDHAFLGDRVTILKGVTIGRHSIIGTGSVVTSNIPPFSIAVGMPARVVRRFDHTRRMWAVP